MTDSAYPPQRPLTVSEVLDLTFRIYRTTLFNCVLLAALGVIFGQIAAMYLLAHGQRPWSSGMQGMQGPQAMQAMLAQLHDPLLIVLYMLGGVFSIIFYGAVLLRQRALLAGRAPGGEVTAALRRILGAIVLGILVLLSIVACFAPAVLAFLPGSGGGVGTRFILVLLGLVAVSYVLIAVSCAWTVFYADGSGALDSFARSWRLTAGNFWRLSVVYTIALIILFVVDALIMGVTGFISVVLGHADVAVVGALLQVVAVALGAFVTPFYTALGLAVLGDLSARREGADLERRIAAA